MKLSIITCAAALGLVFSASGFAAAPPDAPAGTTGLCKDGSYANAAEKKGACRGHKGVKAWYADSATAPAPAKTPTPAAAPTAAATVTPASAPMNTARKGGDAFTPSATAAPGGAPGMVWANDTTKVYHCSGDKWYGKTKHGAYLSEPDAKAKGFHAEHGKACAT